MKTGLLLQQLEEELWRGFTKRYAGHSPSISFHQNLSRETPLSRNDYFTLLIQDNPEYLGLSRLPQSRIRVTEAIYGNFRLRSIALRDDHFFIIEPTTKEKNIKFDIQLDSDIQIQSSFKAISLENNIRRFELNQPLILWLTRSSTIKNLEELPKIFRTGLNREYEQHPISYLNTGNWRQLREIDILWSEIQDINEIAIPKDDYLLWLQEIYIHFGWSGQLNAFYSCNRGDKKLDSFKLMEKRWRSVRDKSEWKASNNQSHYLNQYFSGSADLQQIQQLWVNIHFPAYRLQAVKAIVANPQKYIAVGLLAIQYRFIWADLYFELLIYALPVELHAVIQLLFLLKKQNSFFNFGSHWSYAASHINNSNQKLVNKSESITLSQVYQKTKQITQIKLSESSAFSINKLAFVRIRSESNFIAIRPLWMQPLDNLPSLNLVNIRYNFKRLEIPLAWNHFQIECDGMRIKFLRKKNRYQLNISHIDPERKLEIDGQNVEARDSRDAKLYLPISKQNSKMEIKVLNGWGSKASEGQQLFFSGWVVDVYGVLHQQLNLSTGKGRGSNQIDLNAGLESKTEFFHLKKPFIFSGRFFKKTEMEPEFLNGPLSTFLYSSPEILKHKTVVFTEKSSATIAQIFYKTLGFYPIVRKLPKAKDQLSGFVFLITDSYKDFQVSAEEAIKLISMKNHNNQNGFLVHPQSLETVLTSRLQPK